MAVKNECTDVAIAELERCGIDWQLEDRGKHQAIVWKHTTNGQTRERQFTLPVSASDWRAPMNTRGDLRKILRDDGVLDADNKPVNTPDAFERLIEFVNRRTLSHGKLLTEHGILFAKVDDRFKKVESDVEGMMSLLQTPVPAFEHQEVRHALSEEAISPDSLSVVEKVVNGIAIEKGVPMPEEINYALLEAECAADLRLPQRPGFRIVPEHYVKVDAPSWHDDRALGYRSAVSSAEEADEEEAPRRKKKAISLHGLENLRAGIAKARAAKKSLAEEDEQEQE